MVKTHEITIKGSTAWNQLTSYQYVIIETKDIETNDYILFKEVENLDSGDVSETGLFQMTQVTDVINHEGLKGGYLLIVFKKL